MSTGHAIIDDGISSHYRVYDAAKNLRAALADGSFIFFTFKEFFGCVFVICIRDYLFFFCSCL